MRNSVSVVDFDPIVEAGAFAWYFLFQFITHFGLISYVSSIISTVTLIVVSRFSSGAQLNVLNSTV